MHADVDEDLLARTRRQRERALASGHLQPTSTERYEIEDDGVLFRVRVVTGVDEKTDKIVLFENPGTGG